MPTLTPAGEPKMREVPVPRRATLWTVGTTLGLAALTSPLWRPHLEPPLHLLRRGDLSPEHARLFHGYLTNDEDAHGRFFDEVPNALAHLRSYALARGRREANVNDPELARAVWRPSAQLGSSAHGLYAATNLDASDYELFATSGGWGVDHGTNPADILLALDYPRARRELLARPRHAHALLALIHWGVPVREVRSALGKWTETVAPIDERCLPQLRRAFAARLFLEDQEIEDAYKYIMRRKLPIPRGLQPNRFFAWRRRGSSSAPRPLPSGAPMTRANLMRAVDRIGVNPKDPTGLALLRRAVALPTNYHRGIALAALVEAGDVGALRMLADDLGSMNSGRLQRGLQFARAPAAAPLLGRLAEHPYLWVRLWAAAILAEIGPAGRRDLARFEADRARDVRRIVRGLPPLGIATCSTWAVLNHQNRVPGPYNPTAPTYWTASYLDLGEDR